MALVFKPLTITTVTANPTLTGTELSLNSIDINGTKYKVVSELTLSGYYTKDEADVKIDESVSSLNLQKYATKEEVETAISSLDLTKYYTKDETSSLIDNSAKLSIPRRLKDNAEISLLPKTANRQEVYLYADNNGEDTKISMSTLLSSIFRTVSEEPDDLQVGEYIFMKI